MKVISRNVLKEPREQALSGAGGRASWAEGSRLCKGPEATKLLETQHNSLCGGSGGDENREATAALSFRVSRCQR